MPVTETLWLKDALSAQDLPLDGVILNAVYASRFEEDDLAELRAALARTRSKPARSALRAALSEHARAGTQREQEERLRDALALPLSTLPYVFADRIGTDELEALADGLDKGLRAELAAAPAGAHRQR